MFGDAGLHEEPYMGHKGIHYLIDHHRMREIKTSNCTEHQEESKIVEVHFQPALPTQPPQPTGNQTVADATDGSLDARKQHRARSMYIFREQ